MEWLTSAEGLNARQELEASVREHHPHLRDEEVDLIVDGRLLRMVRERTAEQAPASGQQGGTGEGGAVHEAPSATQLAQLRKGDDETAESYCNRACTIRAELLTIGKEVHMATFAAHVLKGLPPEYGFLCRKLEFSSPDMTVERVCSEVLMEEQTLSIEQSYKQITSDASAFSGAVNAIVATTGVNGKEGKGGREQTDKNKDGKWKKKRAPFKGRCYNCNEEGHMAAKCPNKKKDTTPAAAANVAEGDGKGVALSVACSAANLNTYAVGSKATPNLWHARLGHIHFDAVKRTATSGGVFGMDLEKGGEDMSCTSCHEAKLTRESFPLHDEREEQQNPPPPRTVIVVPVPSVQGGEKPLDRSVGPLGSKAPTAPPPLGPPSVADSAPVGAEDGPLEVDTSMADHEEEEEERAGTAAVELALVVYHSHGPFSGAPFSDAPFLGQMLCPTPSPLATPPAGLERHKHMVLVAASPPYRLSTPVVKPPLPESTPPADAGGGGGGKWEAAVWWLASAPMVASLFAHPEAKPSSSAAEPMARHHPHHVAHIDEGSLEAFESIKDSNNPEAAEPVVDAVRQQPHHVALIAEGFLEARSVLHRTPPPKEGPPRGAQAVAPSFGGGGGGGPGAGVEGQQWRWATSTTTRGADGSAGKAGGSPPWLLQRRKVCQWGWGEGPPGGTAGIATSAAGGGAGAGTLPGIVAAAGGPVRVAMGGGPAEVAKAGAMQQPGLPLQAQ
ncbi:unnamed protein product [Closterium sp. Naga37s-1]|nr:unnamed protein product [Closterium sp. Naga37s-1]